VRAGKSNHPGGGNGDERPLVNRKRNHVKREKGGGVVPWLCGGGPVGVLGGSGFVPVTKMGKKIRGGGGFSNIGAKGGVS